MISGRQRARGAQNGRYGGVGGYAGILYAKTNMAKNLWLIFKYTLLTQKFSKFILFQITTMETYPIGDQIQQSFLTKLIRIVLTPCLYHIVR